MKENYQIILNKTIDEIQKNNTVPSLLLHSCCAPCSSYVLEYLSEYFDITIFYYNPNISPEEEFYKRVSEQKRLINEMPLNRKVKFIEGKYDCEKFYSIAKGLENLKEGGERCFKCYRLRLEETAKTAQKDGFDYFTTTLSISPHKNAQVLNQIGLELEESYGVKYLCSDFKRKTVINVRVNFRKYTVFIVRITAVVFIQSLKPKNVKKLKIITNSRYLCNKFTHARYRQKRYRCRRTYMCCVYAVYFCHQFRTQNVKFVCDKYGLSLVHYQL